MPELALLLSAAPNKQSRDPNRALEMANQACKKTPNSCHAWCALAAAQGANEDFEEASKALKTASELQPISYQTALIAEMTDAFKSKNAARFEQRQSRVIIAVYCFFDRATSRANPQHFLLASNPHKTRRSGTRPDLRKLSTTSWF